MPISTAGVPPPGMEMGAAGRTGESLKRWFLTFIFIFIFIFGERPKMTQDAADRPLGGTAIAGCMGTVRACPWVRGCVGAWVLIAAFKKKT